MADTNGKEKVIEWKKVYEEIGNTEVLKEKTKYEYDSRYRLVKQCRYYGDNLETTGKCYTTIYTYDDTKLTDNPTVTETQGVTNVEGNPAESPIEGGTIRETVNYDWYGRSVEKTDANQYTTQITYDALGRTIRETYSDGTSKTIVYDDELNQITVIDEDGVSRRYKYTPLGKIAKVGVFSADTPETALTGFEYDKIERLSRETIFAEDGTARLVINYTYDPVYQSKYLRKIKTITGDANAPAVVTETLADQVGRVRQETVKGSGSLADAVVSYTYDKLGNKLSQTDALGHVTKWEYDYAGRVVKETNAAGKTSLTVYDALGNKTETTDPAGNTAHFFYDALGRLLWQESPFDDDAKAVVLYDYDAAGNVLRQRTLCSALGEPEQWRKTEYLYDSRNRLTDTLLFEEDGSENRTHYEYNNVGNKLAVYTGMLGDSPDGAQKTSYTYDRFGNVLTMIDPRSNALSPDDALYRVERYNYDKTGRIIPSRLNGLLIMKEVFLWSVD